MIIIRKRRKNVMKMITFMLRNEVLPACSFCKWQAQKINTRYILLSVQFEFQAVLISNFVIFAALAWL